VKKTLVLTSLLFCACSTHPPEADPAPPATSVSKDRREELKTRFGGALATALADSPSLRALLKQEALLQFNRDYDVL
jgi:hypothetical protein